MTVAPPSINLIEYVKQLPADRLLTLNNVPWDEYEELLEQVGEARGLRINYDEGTLQIMTLSPEHENYSQFISGLIRLLSARLRINIRFFGSSTIRSQRKKKGNEPDGCFYVQSVDLIGNRIHLNFSVDPPPDIVVEIDIHHSSVAKLHIYAALGVPEIWRYDGYTLTIYHLEQDKYIEVETSDALPMLSGSLLTDFLTRLQADGEFQALLAFDEWLKSQKQA
ncbi:MAG: Uma2 family endonuclease [Blastocatellia bacterium]|nr:Uma2 family endonuclease [Blastocatellia bacterium]